MTRLFKRGVRADLQQEFWNSKTPKLPKEVSSWTRIHDSCAEQMTVAQTSVTKQESCLGWTWIWSEIYHRLEPAWICFASPTFSTTSYDIVRHPPTCVSDQRKILRKRSLSRNVSDPDSLERRSIFKSRFELLEVIRDTDMKENDLWAGRDQVAITTIEADILVMLDEVEVGQSWRKDMSVDDIEIEWLVWWCEMGGHLDGGIQRHADTSCADELLWTGNSSPESVRRVKDSTKGWTKRLEFGGLGWWLWFESLAWRWWFGTNESDFHEQFGLRVSYNFRIWLRVQSQLSAWLVGVRDWDIKVACFCNIWHLLVNDVGVPHFVLDQIVPEALCPLNFLTFTHNHKYYQAEYSTNCALKRSVLKIRARKDHRQHE